ncbi:hypothetical protein EDB19DRAFT_145437 [Suillus lakei]|nr:hypothetical protein EDB19DRAFT_145437 [Suillus lakei]
MCCWRHVRNVYLRCGHAHNIPDELVRHHIATIQATSKSLCRSPATVPGAGSVPTTLLPAFRPRASRRVANTVNTPSSTHPTSTDSAPHASRLGTAERRISL